LVSYGVDLGETFPRAAEYIDRILKGTKPADLPVQAPTKFELAINLKTAKAIAARAATGEDPAHRHYRRLGPLERLGAHSTARPRAWS